MADYAIRTLEDIPDVLGDYPGEMRMTAASDLGSFVIAVGTSLLLLAVYERFSRMRTDRERRDRELDRRR